MAGNDSCKKTNSLAFVGSNLAWSFAIIKPAAEKTLCDGAGVAGIAKIHAAISASNGKHFSFFLHHSNGLLKAPAAVHN